MKKHRNLVEELLQALSEQAVSEGQEPAQEDAPDEYAGEMLRRDIERESLRRLEKAARTLADFEAVIGFWDRRDDNIERRARYHEISSPKTEILELGSSESGAVIPAPYASAFWKQLKRGEFLDVIFDCPMEIHELVSDEALSMLLRDLRINQKEILYHLAIRGRSTTFVAALFGQTDRNIRKQRAAIQKKIGKYYDSVGKEKP